MKGWLAAALVPLLLACGDATGPANAPLQLQKVSGDGQVGVLEGDPGTVTTLEEPLTVRVTRGGEPVAGAEVHWKVQHSEEGAYGGLESTHCGEISNVDGYVGIYPSSGGSLVGDSTGTQGRSSVTWSNHPREGVSGERTCELEVEVEGGSPSATFTATWREP